MFLSKLNNVFGAVRNFIARFWPGFSELDLKYDVLRIALVVLVGFLIGHMVKRFRLPKSVKVWPARRTKGNLFQFGIWLLGCILFAKDARGGAWKVFLLFTIAAAVITIVWAILRGIRNSINAKKQAEINAANNARI